MGREDFAELKFGTSGIRGKDSDLIDIQIYVATKGFLGYLLDSREVEAGSKIALAGDFRPSTPRIMRAIALAIIDSGFSVDYLGKVPTPTLAYHGFENGIASIMVTGSHNPYGENGVKFNLPGREVLKHDERGILEKLNVERVEEFGKSVGESFFGEDGFLKGFEDLGEGQRGVVSDLDEVFRCVNTEAEMNYVDRYKKAFGNIFEGKKIVFYQQTCVGRELIPRIFRELGAEVILEGKVDETERFVAVDTEDLSEEILGEMAGYARKHDVEVVLTTDGDSDRPVVVFYDKVSDSHGFLRGDKLNVLTVLHLKPDFVSMPISANHKAVNLMRKNGIEVKHTKIGSPHVIKAMIDKMNDSEGELELYAFEVNGGGLLGSVKSFDSGRVLRPLPTRDAVLPMICSIAHAQNKNKNLYQLVNSVFSDESESHSHAGLIENVSEEKFTVGCEEYTSEVGKSIIDKFSLGDGIAHVNFGDVLEVRDYGDDFIAIDDKLINEISTKKDFLLKYVNLIEGLENEDISEINYLDGVRVYLTNGEVLHLRPSGNSSQFRIYSEAASEGRAKEIINHATKPNTGVVVQMVQNYLNEEF